MEPDCLSSNPDFAINGRLVQVRLLGPQFPHLENGDDHGDDDAYIIGLMTSCEQDF